MSPNRFHTPQTLPIEIVTMRASAAWSEQTRANCFQLHFQSLFDVERDFVFPCDAAGNVNLDALGERARIDYLYARALVGREFSVPVVCGANFINHGPRPYRSEQMTQQRMKS